MVLARMQQRRGTSAEWTAEDPILASGEMGFETDTKKFKLGNGTTVWTELDYAASSVIVAKAGGAPNDYAALTDNLAMEATGSGNGVYWNAGTNGDGEEGQGFSVWTGENGEYVLRFMADGILTVDNVPVVISWLSQVSNTRKILSDSPGEIYIGDEAANAASGNGIYWDSGTADEATDQGMIVSTGVDDEYQLKFLGDGILKINDDAFATIREAVNTVAAAGATETIPNPEIFPVNHLTLDSNVTLTFPATSVGLSFTLVLKQDATGSRLVTWPAAVKWSGAAAPILSTGANKVDVITFLCVDGTTWMGFLAGLDIR